MERVLLTGGSGFFGRRIAEALRRHGYEVATPARPDFDLLDANSTLRTFESLRPGIVVHSAAYYGGLGICMAEPAQIFHRNVLMGLNLFEAAAETKVRRIMAIGSACSYPGGVAGNMKEDDFWSGPLHPSVESYGFTKKVLEVGLRAYGRGNGLIGQMPVVTNLYGEHDVFTEYRSHVAAALIKKFADAAQVRADHVVCWGSGAPVREFIYSGDAAEAVARLLKSGYTEPLNIGTGIGTTIKELAELVARLDRFPRRDRLGQIQGRRCHAEGARRLPDGEHSQLEASDEPRSRPDPHDPLVLGAQVRGRRPTLSRDPGGTGFASASARPSARAHWQSQCHPEKDGARVALASPVLRCAERLCPQAEPVPPREGRCPGGTGFASASVRPSACAHWQSQCHPEKDGARVALASPVLRAPERLCPQAEPVSPREGRCPGGTGFASASARPSACAHWQSQCHPEKDGARGGTGFASASVRPTLVPTGRASATQRRPVPGWHWLRQCFGAPERLCPLGEPVSPREGRPPGGTGFASASARRALVPTGRASVTQRRPVPGWHWLRQCFVAPERLCPLGEPVSPREGRHPGGTGFASASAQPNACVHWQSQCHPEKDGAGVALAAASVGNRILCRFTSAVESWKGHGAGLA